MNNELPVLIFTKELTLAIQATKVFLVNMIAWEE